MLRGDTVGNLKEMVSGTQAWFEQERNITDNVSEDKKKQQQPIL